MIALLFTACLTVTFQTADEDKRQSEIKRILDIAETKCLPCDGSGELESLIPGLPKAPCIFCSGKKKPTARPVFYSASELIAAYQAKTLKFGGPQLVIGGKVRAAKAAGLEASIELQNGGTIYEVSCQIFGQAGLVTTLREGQNVLLLATFVNPPRAPDQTRISLNTCRILDQSKLAK